MHVTVCTPKNSTCPIKRGHFKRDFVLQPRFFRKHSLVFGGVNIREGRIFLPSAWCMIRIPRSTLVEEVDVEESSSKHYQIFQMPI